MLPGGVQMPGGLSLRPTRASDGAFLESLHRSTREDLRLVDGEDDFIEELIDMQHRAQTTGYGDMFPNAMYFIIENQGERIGRVVLDFGHVEIRVVDLAFIPAARGKGFGAQTLQTVQMVASKLMAPVVLTVLSQNVLAKQLYLRLGFVVVDMQFPLERMIWYPLMQTGH